MYIEKKEISLKEVKKKSIIANIILVVLFISILFVFWNIQILKNQQFNFLAQKNIYREVDIKAPRGLILDRNGKILAGNKLNFCLFLIKENIESIKKTIKFAKFITEIEEKILLERIEKYKNIPEFFRVPIKKDMKFEKVIYLESRSDEYPEFEITIEPKRTYPYKNIASHVLGYISEITSGELEEMKKNQYKLGDMIGKCGIESQYESALTGKKGKRSLLIDNQGIIQKILKETNPEIGHKIILTLDIELQKKIEQIFDYPRGVIAVIDLQSGGLLSVISKPDFNPEFFTKIIDKKEWHKLITDPAKPLHNKFLQGLYSPGSVFKIAVALAGLQEDIINPSTISRCSGSIRLFNRQFDCWNSFGHGRQNIFQALKNSCNIFFYRLAKKLDTDLIAQYAELLGLGKKTNIDLPNENIGLIPTKNWKQKYLKQTWFPGDTISVSIGQSMVNITPVQMLLMISTVALKGKMPQLHLLKRIESGQKIIKEFRPAFKHLFPEKKNFEIIIEGLYRTVNENGTGRAAKIPGLNICGKTGTVQIIAKDNPDYKKLIEQPKFRPHSWFVSFAPRKNPKIAMIVFIENGGDAGAIAAPLAAKIYKIIFEK